jgi:hypothetical protein
MVTFKEDLMDVSMSALIVSFELEPLLVARASCCFLIGLDSALRLAIDRRSKEGNTGVDILYGRVAERGDFSCENDVVDTSCRLISVEVPLGTSVEPGVDIERDNCFLNEVLFFKVFDSRLLVDEKVPSL